MHILSVFWIYTCENIIPVGPLGQHSHGCPANSAGEISSMLFEENELFEWNAFPPSFDNCAESKHSPNRKTIFFIYYLAGELIDSF